MSKKQVILLGNLGCGKTTLYNKITRSSVKTVYGMESQTMGVYMKESCEGIGFMVLDTPGFGVSKDKIKHVAGVLAALAEGPLNRILILLKNERVDLMIDALKKILPIFHRFRLMITVVVTFWDLTEQQQKEENSKQIIEKLKIYNIKSVIFVGTEDSAQSICFKIDSILYDSQFQNIELTENEIFSNFDIENFPEGAIFDLELQQVQLTTQYGLYRKCVEAHIKSLKMDVKTLPDYLRALITFSKQRIESLVIEFEKQNFQIIDSLTGQDQKQQKAFLIHFQLKKVLYDEYKQLVQLATKIMKNTSSHCYNYIKKCPHCGEIWMKVAGCNSETTCGRIPNKGEDTLIENEIPYKYSFKYENNEIHVTEVQQIVKISDKALIQQNLQVKQNFLNERVEKTSIYNEKFFVGKLGCKQQISWNTMIPLSEAEVQELADDRLIEYFNEMEEELEKRNLDMKNLYEAELKLAIEQQNKLIQKFQKSN